MNSREEFQHVIIVAQFLRRRHFGAPHAQRNVYGMLSLSDYAETLPDEAKKRYKEKISLIAGADPFLRDVGLLNQ